VDVFFRFVDSRGGRCSKSRVSTGPRFDPSRVEPLLAREKAARRDKRGWGLKIIRA